MDLAELQELADKQRRDRKRIRIHCCTSSGRQASNALEIRRRLDDAVAAAGKADQAQVVSVGCMRFCGQGPMVEIDPDATLYEHVTPDDAPSIIAALDGGLASATRGDPQYPFFARQMHIVRQNGGKIDPERIEEYIAAGGYQSLYHVLHELTPAESAPNPVLSTLRYFPHEYEQLLQAKSAYRSNF